MDPGGGSSSGALGYKERCGDRSSWAPPEPSWVMAVAHAAGPGWSRPVSRSTDPPETWSPGWAGPPLDPGLQASSSMFLRPTRPFLQPHLGGALPASVSTRGGGQAPKRAPGAEGPSQASVRGGTAQVYGPPAAQRCPPSPEEGRRQSV